MLIDIGIRVYRDYSFWVKNILSFVLILDTILLRIGLEPNLFNIFKNIWATTFMLILFLFLVGLIPFIGLFRKTHFKHTYGEIELSEKIRTISQEMGLDFTYYFQVPELNNATVTNGALYIGKELEEKWNQDELAAIVAHEFSHITHEKLHIIMFIIGGVISLLITYLIGYGLHLIFIIPLASSCVYLFFHQFAWYRELDCDENAVKYVPVEDLQTALIKFSDENLNEFSFLHPSTMYRVHNLEKKKDKTKNTL